MLILVPIAAVALGALIAAAVALHLQTNPAWWALGGAAIAYLLVYPFRTFRIGTLDPALVARLDGDALVQTRRIVVRGHRKAYNPSLIAHGDGYLLSFRVRHHSLASFVKKVLNVRTSYLGLVPLDRHFKPCAAPYLLNIQTHADRRSETAQDGRLIRWGDQLLLFFNDYGATRSRTSCAIHVVELLEVNGQLQPAAPARMLVCDGMNAIEKNWVPFVAGDVLYLIYATEPHRILRPDLATGRCEEVACTPTEAGWPWGVIRGGTAACAVEGGLLTFFHSSQVLPAQTIFGQRSNRSYTMGAYLFSSAPPFAVTKISPPIGKLDFYDDNRRKVVFASGMVIDDDRIHVVWGKNDTQMWVSTLDRGKLLQALRPVASAARPADAAG